MYKFEVIDNPVEEKWEKGSPRLVSESFADGLHSLSWLMHHTDRDWLKPDEFRLATWVDKGSDKLGQAFGISRPEVIKDSFDDFTVAGFYFTVDRENRQVVKDYPKAIKINSFETVEEVGEKSLEIYDKTELGYAVSMLGKMATAFDRSDYDNKLDNPVSRAILNSHMDYLAREYPFPGSEIIEPQGAA